MLAIFLEQLFQSGQIQLASALPLRTAETAAIDHLKHEEACWRQEFPGIAPELSLDAAYWAARILYRAAQFFAARDLPADAVYADLSEPCPLNNDRPEAIYSVDLTFRYLPDLYRLAAARASADPLVTALQSLADMWPLSGVGIPPGEIRPSNVCHFVEYPGLTRLYIDRIETAQDFSLLTDEKLRDIANGDCGVHFKNQLARITAAAAPIAGVTGSATE